ncbi:hypothetical protein [Staphylococcus pseudoxylosus]|uniref:hypothetical protein n=1 Tax=Staphylococcus pseudoxylosus TaxID=2282419 RepID=UPI00193A5392|nr:hypothetical protein [Staphylococcus pseudoxylosus]MBM2659146.1 hypothetical protein [Staphylococcus pseudoxylosus]MEB5781851.1 hypothetical protein [Staphylococcus pseudoxylosus]
MIKLELLSWFRSKRFLIIFAIFLFSGFSSPLMAYYSNDILNSLSSNEGTKVIMQDPQWQELFTSYFKNASQLVMLICAYIVADTCRLGKDKSMQLYYKTGAINSGRIFYPKLTVSLFIIALGAVVGSLSTLYVTWVFFDSFDLGSALISLFIQMIALLIFSTISATISFWINSPFISALSVEALVFLSIFLNNIDDFEKWSPTTLLRPEYVLSGDIEYKRIFYQVIIGIIVCIVCLIVNYFRPLRVKTKL